MLFFVFTAIVFISELIIAFSLISALVKLDRKFVDSQSLLEEINPKLEELLKLCTKISERLSEIAPMYVKKSKSWFVDFLYSQAKSALIGFLIFLLKKEFKKN